MLEISHRRYNSLALTHLSLFIEFPNSLVTDLLIRCFLKLKKCALNLFKGLFKETEMIYLFFVIH